MIREGREVRSRMYYILGTDHRLFGNVSIRDPRHNSDHYMVMGLPPHRTPDGPHQVSWGAQASSPPPTDLPTREDGIFAALRRAAPNMLARDTRNNAWILEATRRLVDKRVFACQDLTKDQILIWRLGRAIKTILRDNRRRRTEKVVSEVKSLMG